MLPDFIPNLSIGPLCGLTANAVLAVLCLVISIIYYRYRPLRSLFFFYVFITFAFLGWFFWGLQRSPESVPLGVQDPLCFVGSLASHLVLVLLGTL